MDANEARAALDGVNIAQRELALKATFCPPWRHAAFAAITASLVLAQGFPLKTMLPIFTISMAAVVLLMKDDRKRYGMFINGYRKGRTLPLTLALVGTMLVCMFAEIHARVTGLSLATRFGIAAIAFIVAAFASVSWHRIFRRELMDGVQ